jgi:hypothetical protein
MVTGRVLNGLIRDIATRRVIPGAGIRYREIPGEGTQIWTTPVAGVTPLWDLQIVNPETKTVKITNPGLIKRTPALDNSSLVSIAGLTGEFTAAAGKLLVVKFAADLTAQLLMVDEWDGWPEPYDTVETDDPGFWVLESYYYPLWDFRATSTDPAAVPVGDSLWAERRAHNDHLQMELTRAEDKHGHVFSGWFLFPSVGCRR